MHSLYFVMAAFDRTYFNRVLQYASYCGVFEMLKVDKMEHRGSFRVHKNEIILKIN